MEFEYYIIFFNLSIVIFATSFNVSIFYPYKNCQKVIKFKFLYTSIIISVT